MSKQLRITFPLLLICVFLIRLLAANRLLVEKYYSTGIYPLISKVLRYAFGWLPFSLGDIIYGLAFLWLLIKIVKLLILVFNRKYNWQLFLQSIVKLFILSLAIYILFNVLWGLNYNRIGIAEQLNLKITTYSKEELILIDSLLLQKANESKTVLLRNESSEKATTVIFNQAKKSYQNLATQYSFCNYQPASIKSSVWGWLGNYLGFTGYYNPFTGEAQVNTTVPAFLQPYTTCHEMAHQLGYAKENEANFVGYLAAVSADDTAFHYSVYLDLFLYAQRNLYNVDSMQAKSMYKKMLPEVKADLLTWRKFNEQFKNPVEPFFTWMYGKYLKNNGQPSGVLSYDEVTGFLIAYYKKFGKL